jgi:hypothetical protein
LTAFYHGKIYVLILTKNGLGYILGDFYVTHLVTLLGRNFSSRNRSMVGSLHLRIQVLLFSLSLNAFKASHLKPVGLISEHGLGPMLRSPFSAIMANFGRKKFASHLKICVAIRFFA